jgi:hypothetical protein
LDGVVNDDTYKRQSAEIELSLHQIAMELIDLEGSRSSNIKELEQLLLLSRDIYKAYQETAPNLKRRYLALFWERIEVENKVIKKAILTQLFRAALPEKSEEDLFVITKLKWLAAWSDFRMFFLSSQA